MPIEATNTSSRGVFSPQRYWGHFAVQMASERVFSVFRLGDGLVDGRPGHLPFPGEFGLVSPVQVLLMYGVLLGRTEGGTSSWSAGPAALALFWPATMRSLVVFRCHSANTNDICNCAFAAALPSDVSMGSRLDRNILSNVEIC